MRHLKSCLEFAVGLIAIALMVAFLVYFEFARWNTFRVLSEVMR